MHLPDVAISLKLPQKVDAMHCIQCNRMPAYFCTIIDKHRIPSYNRQQHNRSIRQLQQLPAFHGLCCNQLRWRSLSETVGWSLIKERGGIASPFVSLRVGNFKRLFRCQHLSDSTLTFYLTFRLKLDLKCGDIMRVTISHRITECNQTPRGTVRLDASICHAGGDLTAQAVRLFFGSGERGVSGGKAPGKGVDFTDGDGGGSGSGGSGHGSESGSGERSFPIRCANNTTGSGHLATGDCDGFRIGTRAPIP